MDNKPFRKSAKPITAGAQEGAQGIANGFAQGWTRRGFITKSASSTAMILGAGGAFANTQSAGDNAAILQDHYDETNTQAPKRTKRNLASFQAHDWQTHFETLKNGAILIDIASRMAHFWSEDEITYKLYPCSIPVSEDLTKRGTTKIIRKVVGPSWAPTPDMKKRNPDWPDYVAPGPDNPLGTHALYLTWRYYRIHGTHDPHKIGRRASNGCIGLYNEHIADLFALANIGTQVVIL